MNLPVAGWLVTRARGDDRGLVERGTCETKKLDEMEKRVGRRLGEGGGNV